MSVLHQISVLQNLGIFTNMVNYHHLYLKYHGTSANKHSKANKITLKIYSDNGLIIGMLIVRTGIHLSSSSFHHMMRFNLRIS